MRNILTDISGFSLIEILVVVVVLGIIAGIAMQSMTATVDDVRRVETDREMEMLGDAIVGDPSIRTAGTRSDFGYVGDVGAFPPDLQALYRNPGGYSTWDGPYVPPGFTQDSIGYSLDAWGKAYTYTDSITIISSGSGSAITHKIADAASDYLQNIFSGSIKDANDSVPGTMHMGLVDIKITTPDGSGGNQTSLYHPDSAGGFTLNALPVGTHPLRFIYTPVPDTLLRYITILPRHKSSRDFRFAYAHFVSALPPDSLVFEEFSEAREASGNTSLTIPTPLGTVAGDLLIAAVVTDASETISPPGGEGWTLIDMGDGSNQVTLGVWWKLADAAESASHRFTWGSYEEAYGWIMRFTGHDPVNPINASQMLSGPNSSTPPSPSVTATVDNTIILRIGGFDNDNITEDNPGLPGHTAMTMDKSNSGNGSCSGGAGYTYQSAAGASGPSNFQLTAGEQYRCVTIAIAPAP